MGHDLGQQADQYASYAISFAVIGLLWFRHHRFFHDLAEINAKMIVLNLVYLAFVALVPFPTELIGEYGNQPIAVALYAANIAAIGTLAAAMWWYAGRADLYRPGLRVKPPPAASPAS